jgi:MarR family transcriptional regulator, organic hydroperoxide resistance regulator
MGTIRDEIRQTKPFPSPADEAVVTLLGTADRVRAALSRVVEAHEITLQQYNVLRILRGAGPGGLPTLDIAARMIERSPGITRLLDRLETRNLVRRVRCPEDRRQVLCHAKGAALLLLAGLDGPVAEAGRRALAPLDRSRTAELIHLLDAVRATTASSVTTDANQQKDPKTGRQERRK